jgi:hypothetical protein
VVAKVVTDEELIERYRATGEEELAARAFNVWRDVQDDEDTTTWLDLTPLQRKAWRTAVVAIQVRS